MHYLLSSIGNVRKRNEDYGIYTLLSKDIHMYMVLDGIGGYSSGDVASSVAGSKVVEYLSKNTIKNKLKKDTIREAVIYANREVYKMNMENKEYRGMGTTISLLIIQKDVGYVVNIGDSRIYKIKEVIEQITEDDTYINALLKDNIINKDEADSHPQKHMLLKAIGVGKNIDFELKKIRIEDGDEFLLCTDGLTNMMRDDEILKLIKANKGERIVEKLVYMANKKGGNDNVTVMYVECDNTKEKDN